MIDGTEQSEIKTEQKGRRTCVQQKVQFVLADSQPGLHFESRLQGSFCGNKLSARQDM